MFVQKAKNQSKRFLSPAYAERMTGLSWFLISHRSFVLHSYPLEILPFVKNKLNPLHSRQNLNIGSNHIVLVQKAWQKPRYVFKSRVFFNSFLEYKKWKWLVCFKNNPRTGTTDFRWIPNLNWGGITRTVIPVYKGWMSATYNAISIWAQGNEYTIFH